MPDRTIDDVVKGLVALQRELGALATEALRLTPTFWFPRFRRQLRTLEDRLDHQLTAFMNLDADLVDYASTPPADFNSAVRAASWFQMYFGVRDSVRGLLADTSSTLSGLRSELVVLESLLVSLVAIVISIAALTVEVLK